MLDRLGEMPAATVVGRGRRLALQKIQRIFCVSLTNIVFPSRIFSISQEQRKPFFNNVPYLAHPTPVILSLEN